MASTFIGIEMGKKSLYAEQTAMKTSGHNISNANTDGYTRQRVTLQTEVPIYDPSLTRDQRPGQYGQGVETQKIERIRDHFIDERILDERSHQSFWKSRNDYLYQIEMVHNEPDDKNIRSLMDQYWNSLQELANNPSENAVREVTRERARTLTQSINHTYSQLDEIQRNVNQTVKTRVDEINQLTESIRQLNVQIQRSENVGDKPNDLYDRRDLLVEQLSKLADVTVSNRDPDEYIVYLGTVHLVQGEHREEISIMENPANKGYYDLKWQGTAEPVRLQSGEVASLLQLRDVDLDQQIRQVNSLAANLTDLVNEIHRDGFDLNNNTNLDFFKTMPITQNANGDFDRNNDGTPEITALFKVAGTKKLDMENEIGIAGTITLAPNNPGAAAIKVNYVPQDKVRDVIRKVNEAQAEVVAYLNHSGQLSLKATLAADGKNNMDFAIRHIEDSGDLLVNYSGILRQSGAAGAFDWQTTGQINQLQAYAKNVSVTPMFNPASWAAVSDAINLDTRSIAASRGTDMNGLGDYTVSNGPGDGGNALLMAELRQKKTMIGSNETFNDFYTSVISRTGTLAEQADVQTKTADKLLEQLTQLRQSVSGVNLDEEMANLIMFQHAYNATARFITVQDRMLETIIRMGL